MPETRPEEAVEKLAERLDPGAFEKTNGLGHQEFSEGDREDRETARRRARDHLDALSEHLVPAAALEEAEKKRDEQSEWADRYQLAHAREQKRVEQACRDLEFERQEATRFQDERNDAEGMVEEACQRCGRAEAKLEDIRAALEPFAVFASNNVDEDGWKEGACRSDRIVDWFGPSEFRAAKKALDSPTQPQQEDCERSAGQCAGCKRDWEVQGYDTLPIDWGTVEVDGQLRSTCPDYPGCQPQQVEQERHRVVIEFDGYSPSVTLLHPETGCPQGEDGEPCYLTDWLENEGAELLRGTLTVPVRIEQAPDRDHPLFHLEPPHPSQEVTEEEVEAAAEALWNEREFRDPTGDEPEGWCPPGHDVHQQPPHEPDLWAPLAAAGKYPASLDETRADARAALQAARRVSQPQPDQPGGDDDA